MKQNKGVSLIYVLIVLSIVSVFSVGFVYFIKEKSEIILLKERTKIVFSNRYLINKEKEKSEKLLSKELYLNGKKAFLEDKNKYFDSTFENKNTENDKAVRLLFFDKNIESIGGFKIKEILDTEGIKYNLPLEENKVYKNLIVIYSKKILDNEIIFNEKLEFKRKDPLIVEIILKDSYFTY